MNDNTGPNEPEIITFLRSRDYRWIRELGNGACGRTVLLHDDQIDEQFVCKKYDPQNELDKVELFSNFVREIKLLHRVHHPNVVRVFNYYLYPNNLSGFILMEFVDGLPIDQFLAASPQKTNEVFLQVIDGFEYLARSGILHRDIRPRNLLVTSDGVAKIIDLGFGKRVTNSNDFHKSISLNWWCELPDEFQNSKYEFATEVYFVGKLFEKIIRDIGIAHFQYIDALRSMCDRAPETRSKGFTEVVQRLRNNQFFEISFTSQQTQAYRYFAEQLCDHISKIENGTKYVDDLRRIERQLHDAYQKFMLEEYVPDSAIISRCFIDGAYYYKKDGFDVQAVRDFLQTLRSCTPEQGQILLANLHTRLNSLARYVQGAHDDIPF